MTALRCMSVIELTMAALRKRTFERPDAKCPLSAARTCRFVPLLTPTAPSKH